MLRRGRLNDDGDRKMRLFSILLSLVLMLAVLAACQSAAPTTEPDTDTGLGGEVEETGEPIRIGFASGLTGPGAFVATAGRDGVTLAVEEINAAGGVLGRQIELVIQDTKGQPTEAVNVLRRFVSQDNIRLIIGPQTSTSVLAALPVMEELQSVAITSMSTNPTITEMQGVGGNTFMFRVNPPDDAMARALVNIAVNQLGDTRIATVARNDDLGRGATDQFVASIEEFGGEVTSSDFFQSGGSYDFSSTLTRLRDENPDAVIFVGTIEEGIPFIRQFYEQGLEANIYTRGVSISPALYEGLGPELVNGLHAAEPYFAEIDTPENQDFVERWQARYDALPINQGYYSYAAMHLMADAIEAAGSTDPDAVRQALATVSYEGVTGPLTFDDHNQAYANIYIGRVDCSGSTPDTCSVSVIASAASNE